MRASPNVFKLGPAATKARALADLGLDHMEARAAAVVAKAGPRRRVAMELHVAMAHEVVATS